MNDAQATTTLYRPTGEAELRLLADSRYRAWPPRLLEQPIFYPVTNEEYAVQIARDWNATSEETGFVTVFEVGAEYLAQFDRQVVGDAAVHTEYWIPSEQLEEFNANIVGPIRVVRAFRGTPPTEVSIDAELARVAGRS